MEEIRTTDASEIPESDGTDAGVVILNVTLDQLEQANIRLTDDSLLNSTSVQVVDDDQTLLEKLLREWNLLQLLPVLKESGITHRSLVYLSKEDIRDAVSDIGLRAEFRAKLFSWRKTEHNIDDDTLTLNSKVASWLEKTSSADVKTSTSGSQSQYSQCKLSKNLSDLLNQSVKGRAILEHYRNNTSLDKLQRDILVSIILEDIHKTIILEDIQYNGQYLAPKDYPHILKEIESVFPSEKAFLDYYFFSRKKRKNPGGRLYNKFNNSNTKLRKIENIPNTASPECHSQAFDVEILNSIKTSLRRDFSDWIEVKDKWEKTFVLRRQELKNSNKLNIVEFIKDWPLYSHTKSKDLIDIDFRLLFPGKDISLYSKWELFKGKIKIFYAGNIKDKSCKELLSSINDKTDINSEDYILATLLNSVILPTSRFGVEKGSNKRKVTIRDAQDSFTLRVPTINDFDHSVEELRSKHFNKGLTLQPFIVVVGHNANEITKYFVYFDKCIQQHDSYLSCLDACFKLFHVLCLEYPQASYGPWYFIQKYFFEIETEYDKPLPSVSSLTAFLNSH